MLYKGDEQIHYPEYDLLLMMFVDKDNEDGYVPMSAGDAAATWHLHRSHLPPANSICDALCLFSSFSHWVP